MNYARSMISSYKRFQALISFLKVTNPHDEDPNDRLRKIRFLHDHFKDCFCSLFKPIACWSAKARPDIFSGSWPSKSNGVQSSAACDAESTILVNSEVYTGQVDSAGSLAHVVLHLVDGCEKTGHVVLTDNFSPSTMPAGSLCKRGTHFIGTICLNRRVVSDAGKKDTRQFDRYSEPGEMHYIRNGPVVYQQWKDTRCGSMLSTARKGSDNIRARRTKNESGWCVYWSRNSSATNYCRKQSWLKTVHFMSHFLLILILDNLCLFEICRIFAVPQIRHSFLHSLSTNLCLKDSIICSRSRP